MHPKIIKPEDLPVEEKVYLKKSFDGWRVVHPFKNEDRSWNLKNLFCNGSYWNIIKVLVILILIIGMVWSYKHDVKEYKTILENIYDDPYLWCATLPTRTNLNDYFSDFNTTLNIK